MGNYPYKRNGQARGPRTVKTAELETVTMIDIYASALINGDFSGLEYHLEEYLNYTPDNAKREAARLIRKISDKWGECVDVEDLGVAYCEFHRIQAQCALYYFKPIQQGGRQ